MSLKLKHTPETEEETTPPQNPVKIESPSIETEMSNQYTDDSLTTANIGDLKKAEETKEGSNKLITSGDKDQVISDTQNRNQDLRSMWDDDAKRDTYSDYDTKHSQNTPGGNFNQKSFDYTIKSSRLTDRINNRLFTRPGQHAVVDYNTGVRSPGTPTQYYKQSPLETEETRQMNTDRSLEALARRYGVDLSGEMQRYAFDLRKASDTSAMDLIKSTGISDIQFNDILRKSFTDFNYNVRSQNDLSLLTRRFATEITQYMNAKYARLIYDTMVNHSGVIASLATQFFNGTPLPEITQTIQLELLPKILGRNPTVEEALTISSFTEKYLTDLKSKISGATVVSNAENFVKGAISD